MNGRDVFVCLPTGSGKSLCHCLLSEVFNILKMYNSTSIVLLVSTLISLMKDQVRAMTERNVSAVYTGSKDDNTETDIICDSTVRVFVESARVVSFQV